MAVHFFFLIISREVISFRYLVSFFYLTSVGSCVPVPICLISQLAKLCHLRIACYIGLDCILGHGGCECGDSFSPFQSFCLLLLFFLYSTHLLTSISTSAYSVALYSLIGMWWSVVTCLWYHLSHASASSCISYQRFQSM